MKLKAKLIIFLLIALLIFNPVRADSNNIFSWFLNLFSPTEPNKCIDSDNGFDIYNYGCVTYTHNGKETTYCDACAGSTGVWENYCKDNQYVTSYKSCPTGYECKDGKCVLIKYSTQPIGVPRPNFPKCKDGDNGINVETASHVIIGNRIFYPDKCEDEETLTEYYCGNRGEVKYITYNCKKHGYLKCYLGRCIKKECEDTDNGKNYFIRGKVISGSEEHTDYCINNEVLREFYCNKNHVDHVDYNCKNHGYAQCFGGTCVNLPKKNICKDSDGLNYYNKGYVFFNGRYYYDECINSNTLKEYFCSNNVKDEKIVNCPYGCSNGACKEKVEPSRQCKVSVKVVPSMYSLYVDVYHNGKKYNVFTTISAKEGDKIKVVPWFKGFKQKEFTVNCDNPTITFKIEPLPGVKCVDYDNGKDIYKKSYVKLTYEDDTITYYDVCIGNNYLQERYCKDNIVYQYETTCPNGCSNGACKKEQKRSCNIEVNVFPEKSDIYLNDEKVCSMTPCTITANEGDDLLITSEGFLSYETKIDCEKKKLNVNLTVEPGSKCYSSDYSGIYIPSYVILETPEGKTRIFSDTCIDSSTIKEYYCFTNKPKYRIMKCPDNYECKEGIVKDQGGFYCAVKEKCIDSDNGQDEFTYGYVEFYEDTGAKETHYDMCFNSTTVRENYCNENDEVEVVLLRCPPGYVCKDGACVVSQQEIICEETDEGKDYFNKGITELKIGNQVIDQATDYCKNDETLIEFLCKDNGIVNETHICPCEEGACVQTYIDTCQDSDGDNLFTKGKVVYGTKLYEDSCSNGKVVEYVCINNKVGTLIRDCPSGYECKDGACKKSKQTNLECVDTDNGIDFYNYGEVSFRNKVYKDHCILDTNWLKEYYCYSNRKRARLYKCPYKCYQGECINEEEKEIECVDADGKNPHIKAQVTYGDEIYEDFCVDDNTLIEYYCYNGKVRNETYECNCYNGKCEEESECIDTDNGIDIFNKGTVIYNNTVYEDRCYEMDEDEKEDATLTEYDATFSYEIVIEHFCHNGKHKSVRAVCPLNSKCINGKCEKYPSRYYETDNGIDIYTPGIVADMFNYILFFDSCINSSDLNDEEVFLFPHFGLMSGEDVFEGDILIEYFINKTTNSMDYKYVICKCVNGRCIE